MNFFGRSNRATRPLPVDPSLSISQDDIRRGSDRWTSWHWGLEPQQVVDCHDPDMPRVLIECGRLIRLHVRAPRTRRGSHPRRVRDTMVEFSRSVSNKAHIAFDPEHGDQRLYFILPPNVRKVIKERFWDQNRADPMNLNKLALAIGGRHGQRPDYPNVTVRPIGICTAVVYYTNKKGDGQSYYIHKMAEMTAHFAALAVDAKGRLWLAGGNYTTPDPGITD